jgi:hypothetical protein
MKVFILQTFKFSTFILNKKLSYNNTCELYKIHLPFIPTFMDYSTFHSITLMYSPHCKCD